MFPTFDLRIIGVPRSGTNITKYLIETHTSCHCCFDNGWWKHGIIPLNRKNDLPTVILFRNPYQQLVSFYRFSLKGRIAIRGDRDLHKFMSSPVIMYDPRSKMQISFPTPYAYWLDYYDAALNWRNADKVLVLLDDLQAAPATVVKVAEMLCPRKAVFNIEPRLPNQYMGRNRGDEHISEKWNFDTEFSLNYEIAETNKMVEALNFSRNLSHVAKRLDDVYRRLLEQRIRS